MSSKTRAAGRTIQPAQQTVSPRLRQRGPVAFEQRLPGATGLQHAMVQPAQASAESIQGLQRAAGNWAVSRHIQAKLMVGAANDYYEREADRLATQVLSMPGPAMHSAPGARPQSVQRQAEEEEEVQTKPLAASVTPLVQRQEEEEEEVQAKPLIQRQAEEEEEVQAKPLIQRQAEEEEEVQTKPLVQRQNEEEEEPLQPKRAVADMSGSFDAGRHVESRLAASRGNGSPLPGEVRAYMEPRFGADLSGVRLHADSESTQLNRELGARAFTHGKDIYLRTGDADPASSSGRELLAHELTHTLQQGGVQRIQRWWPAGHRLVTQAAIKEGQFGNIYSKEAQDYLVDRSPDIDFIQDQILSMNEGIGIGSARIQTYESLIKAGQDQQARQMWEKNELHYRDPRYMLSHGEGGLYKQDKSASSAINAAMTSSMVLRASSLWKWDDPNSYGPSLSLLSDALHQAEDRGSHGEGTKFRGHDSRLNVKQWAKESKRPLKDWERWEGAPPEAAQGTWMPDNYSVNQVGGVLGVGFAQGVLRMFALRIRKGNMQNAAIPGPGASATEKRFMRARSWMSFQSKSSGPGAKVIGKTANARSTAGKASILSELLRNKEELKLIGQLGEHEYEEAMKPPVSAVLPATEQERLGQGMEYYMTGAGLDAVFTDAETRFRELAKSRFRKGGKKKSERIAEAKSYYIQKTAPHKDNRQQLAVISDTILKAYEQVFHERLYPLGQTPWEQLNKMGIQ